MFGKAREDATNKRAVGQDLAKVLPDDSRAWYKQSYLIRLNVLILSAAFLSAANGYDTTMMNGLQALPEWNAFMNAPSGAWLGFINSVQALSSFAVYPLLAWAGNRWGRKPGLYVGYVFLLAGVFLQGFTPNETGFIIGRALIGQTSACWNGLAPLLITELAYPTHRTFFTALYECGWYIGSILAAWVTFGTRNYGNNWTWRIPSFVQLAIPMAILPGIFLIPESPRFFVSKDNPHQARQILTKYHAGGDENSLLVDFEITEMKRAIEVERSLRQNAPYLDLFRTHANRYRSFLSITVGAFSHFNGIEVVSYYLSLVLNTAGVTDVTHQTLINGCLQIWSLIFAVSGAIGVDRIGRRPLWLIGSAGMLSSFIFISGLTGSFAEYGHRTVGIAVVPFLFIYYAFYAVGIIPLLVTYPAEIWPYNLRSRGMALTQQAIVIASFFNVFVNPIALDNIGWKYYLVFVVLLLVILVTIYFFYPETKGFSLEEIAIIFDGDGARVISQGAVATDIVGSVISNEREQGALEPHGHLKSAM